LPSFSFTYIMLEQNVMIGMKVVAHAKTVGCHEDPPMQNEHFLYVESRAEGYNRSDRWNLSAGIMKYGNHYKSCDFEPIELCKPKKEKGTDGELVW